MKLLIPNLIIILFLISLNTDAQTTQDEFNFITKGYKVQMESGLDMKKGYILKDINEFINSYGLVNTTFKGLYKEGKTKPVAIMMICSRKIMIYEYTYYLCIPSINSSEDIWSQAEKLFFDNLEINTPINRATTTTLLKFISFQMTK